MKKISSMPYIAIFLIAGLLLAACRTGAAPGGADGTATPLPAAIANTQIVVDGRLVPRETVALGFNSTGEISEVLVEEGDVVKAGDVLARLGNREGLEASIANANLELATAQQELLSAQDALDQLSRDLPERQTQALQALTDAKDALRKAEIKSKNINSPASTADLNEARANYSVTKNRLEKAQEDFDPYEKRSDTNLQRAYYLSRLADAQRKFEAAEKNLNKLLGGTSGFFESQSEAELKIAQDRLDQAQKDYDTLMAGPDPDEVALAENRIKTAESRITAAESSIKSTESALADLDLVATIDGTIVKEDLIEGQRVTPGQEVVKLADLSKLYVETDNLTEIEVVDIAVGDKATITPDALPDLKLTGVVETISNEFEEKRGDVTYTTRLRLEDVDPRLRWGMTMAVVFDK